MGISLWDSYPPKVSDDQLQYLAQTVKDWTIFNGLTVRPNPSIVSEESNPNHVLATNAPVTLYPSPFPKQCFEQAEDLQKVYNELYAAIATDEEWLGEVMKELVEVDDFLANLWKIHLQVKEEGYVQDLSLGMFRSDYMLHVPDDSSSPSLKQVEFNTISSSFGGLAVRVADLHRELATYPDPTHSISYPPHPLFNTATSASITSGGYPPTNEAVDTLASALITAHQSYRDSRTSPPLPQCILFLVQDNERNLFDQMALSQHIRTTNREIPTFRIPTSKILSQTSIPASSENPSRPLIYTHPANPNARYEVTVVYFRALYAPTEYDTPAAWAARHHLERSAAIKCPSILLHLSGSKKVQQVLTSTDPSHLERFLPKTSKETLDSLRASFAPQYSMSEGPDSEGVRIALDPDLAQKHVLKPQREGGGNNIYRSNIPTFLKGISEKEYKQYILMELIQPPSKAGNVALRSDGQIVSGDVISELGIFGTCLWRSKVGSQEKNILQNRMGGYLLRTKARDSDEGGVAAGFSSLDSLILYEEAV
ncbi:Glutathione synthetase [Lithohypha guttulata]|nr:Glutathione synthetase [Lithohypha guttulata]